MHTFVDTGAIGVLNPEPRFLYFELQDERSYLPPLLPPSQGRSSFSLPPPLSSSPPALAPSGSWQRESRNVKHFSGLQRFWVKYPSHDTNCVTVWNLKHQLVGFPNHIFSNTTYKAIMEKVSCSSTQMPWPGLEPTLCWSETPETESSILNGALNCSASTENLSP